MTSLELLDYTCKKYIIHAFQKKRTKEQKSMNLDDLDIVKIFLCKQKLWLHPHLMDLKYILEEGLKFHISGALNHWSWSKAHQTMMLAWSTVPERNMSLSTSPCFTTATLSLSGKKVMQKKLPKKSVWSTFNTIFTMTCWLFAAQGEVFWNKRFFSPSKSFREH